MLMPVLVQKEGGSRWLDRFVVLILIAIIAIHLSTYLMPEKDVAGEEARLAALVENRLAALVERWGVEHEREQNALAAARLQEKTDADAKLAELSRRIGEIQSESDQKLGKLSAALDQQQEDAKRQMSEHTQWLERLADQIGKTKRDSVAAFGGARPIPGLNIRLAIPLNRVAELFGDDAAGENRQAQPGAEVEPAAPAIPAGPDHALLFKRAEDFYRAGKYQAASQVYSDLINQDPKARVAYLRRGDCFASERQFDKAIADFTTAIGLAPDDPRAYLARSWAYLGKGATDQAMTDAQKALQLEPTLAEAHLIRTELFARKGQPDQAGAARADALAVFYRRGVDSIVRRDYEAGIADLERVIRRSPEDANAHAWCAKAHYLRSDFPNAVNEYSKVIALLPNDKQSYNNRGMAFFRMEQHGAALADFDQAIRLDPKFAEAYLNRGTARLALGDAARAAQDFSAVLELEPRSAAEAYRLRSAAYATMGWPLKAAKDQKSAESLER